MTNSTKQSSSINRRSVLQAGAAASMGSFLIPAKAAVELRLTHPADPSHPVHIEAEKMVKRISDRTNGEVKITIFPNNALGSPVETALVGSAQSKSRKPSTSESTTRP